VYAKFHCHDRLTFDLAKRENGHPQMRCSHQELFDAIELEDVPRVRVLLEEGLDLNVCLEGGATPLLLATVLGNLELVELLLEHGADPGLAALEPGALVYAEYPLEFAAQARFLTDWNKYHPVATLLQSFGARRGDGTVDSAADMIELERSARAWQSRSPRTQ
jgi:hypothetical protein